MLDPGRDLIGQTRVGDHEIGRERQDTGGCHGARAQVSELVERGREPGADVLARNDGVGAWGTITALAESPVQAGLLWTGTDDGLVQVSRDGGKTLRNVTDRMPGPARKGRISRIDVRLPIGPSRSAAGPASARWN